MYWQCNIFQEYTNTCEQISRKTKANFTMAIRILDHSILCAFNVFLISLTNVTLTQIMYPMKPEHGGKPDNYILVSLQL